MYPESEGAVRVVLMVGVETDGNHLRIVTEAKCL